MPLCGSRPLDGCGSVSVAKSTSGGLCQAEQGQDCQRDKPYPLHPVRKSELNRNFRRKKKKKHDFRGY